MKQNETTAREVAVSFLCGGDRLYGILHQPLRPASTGILIVTGRPALRVGRHRLFVSLARSWAEAGIPVMRFDFRGTGDCEGEMGTLDETSEDIASAVNAFMSNAPGLQNLILWGLCGGAADSILYAARDPRVIGIAMVNPWYYDARVRGLSALNRLGLQGYDKVKRWARSIGKTGKTRAAEIIADQFTTTIEATHGDDISSPTQTAAVERAYSSYRVPNLSKRLAENLERFDGHLLLILSGRDTGSRAFKHAASLSPKWRRLLSAPRVRSHELPEANHSLRRPEWREQASTWTIEWIQDLEIKSR
jgi:exosortase A-associated hydrolase 1